MARSWWRLRTKIEPFTAMLYHALRGTCLIDLKVEGLGICTFIPRTNPLFRSRRSRPGARRRRRWPRPSPPPWGWTGAALWGQIRPSSDCCVKESWFIASSQILKCLQFVPNKICTNYKVFFIYFSSSESICSLTWLVPLTTRSRSSPDPLRRPPEAPSFPRL